MWLIQVRDEITSSVALLLRYYDILKDAVDKDEREVTLQLWNVVRKAL